MQALDGAEVRAALVKDGAYEIETVLDGVSNDGLFGEMLESTSDEPAA